MFLKFLYPLVDFFSAFNIFQYITFRAAYAAITALLISFLLGPWIINKLKKMKVGESIREDGPKRHREKSGTPTMGGILIIVAVVISVVLWQDIDKLATWILLFAILGFGCLGFVDDYIKLKRTDSRGLQISVKLIGQIILSSIIAVLVFIFRKEHTTLLYIPFLKNAVLDLSWVFIPFAILLLIATSNSVNFTDGLDGLASGLMIIVSIVFAILAYLAGRPDYAEYLQIPFVPGSGEFTVLCLSIMGALVGFLWFNSHPAEIMMGDTGSLALGGVIGVLALILKKEILLIIIGGVFIIEFFSVIIQVFYFKLTGKRVFKMAPLHHHFELKGWAESKIVIRFWILGGLLGLLSLSTLKIQ